MIDTDYGALIGARRTQPDGSWYWRVTQFLLPFYTMPPVGIGEKVVQSHIWVPMDDTHVINWMVTWHLERPLTREEIALHIEGKGAHVCDFAPATSEPYGDIRTAANRDNDYFMDWEAHRTRMFCGIPGFGVQDQAIQESQGPIVDRASRAAGDERHGDHPGAPAADDGGARAARRRDAAARPGSALVPGALGLDRAGGGGGLGGRGQAAGAGAARADADAGLNRDRKDPPASIHRRLHASPGV